jgi:GNAT superfamily N-acetyltransferase
MSHGASDGLAARLATMDDLPALRRLMDAAIGQLQAGFLTPAQIAASRHIMGLDTQLIEDGTYYLVTRGDAVAGCGGWSRRNTLYGGDHSPGRDAALLDPARDAARIRAMYTHPDHARRGVGRLILSVCERAAASAGFSRVELAATLSGEPLYTAAGYMPIRHFFDDRGGEAVKLILMGKPLPPHVSVPG